jgi:hypothetical protein
LARNQNNVSEWYDMSLKIDLFSTWYSWKITELALNNNHSLTSLCVSVACVSGLFILFAPSIFSDDVYYCKRTFLRWHQFLWFLQKALIHGFLNSWLQTLQTTINGKNVFRWIFIFVV